MEVALEAVKHIGDAETPFDIFREYQDWLTRELELLAEDGKACQQQVLRAAAHASAQPEEQEALRAAAHPSAQSEAPQTGKRRTG
jgi:hypothetical protein